MQHNCEVAGCNKVAWANFLHHFFCWKHYSQYMVSDAGKKLLADNLQKQSNLFDMQQELPFNT